MRFAEIDRFLVPRDLAPARRYFNDALYVPQGLRGRIRRSMGRPRFRNAPTVSGIETLIALVDEFPESLAGRQPGGGDLPAIYLRDYGTSDRGRVLAFWFDHDEAETPAAVVKAQHPRRGPESLESEAQALEQMRAFLPPALKPTLPRVLAYRASKRGELLVTSAMEGRSGYVDLQGSLAPWRYVEAHFTAAARWLSAFHDATRSSVSSTIAGQTVFHSASHGDFWVRNLVLNARGEAGVVDWEHFIPAASPFVDLFHYPLTYGINYPWRRYHRVGAEEAFRLTFVETNRVSRAVRRYLDAYAEKCGLSQPVLREAFREFVASEGRMHRSVPPRPGTAELPWSRFATLTA